MAIQASSASNLAEWKLPAPKSSYILFKYDFHNGISTDCWKILEGMVPSLHVPNPSQSLNSRKYLHKNLRWNMRRDRSLCIAGWNKPTVVLPMALPPKCVCVCDIPAWIVKSLPPNLKNSGATFSNHKKVNAYREADSACSRVSGCESVLLGCWRHCRCVSVLWFSRHREGSMNQVGNVITVVW